MWHGVLHLTKHGRKYAQCYYFGLTVTLIYRTLELGNVCNVLAVVAEAILEIFINIVLLQIRNKLLIYTSCSCYVEMPEYVSNEVKIMGRFFWKRVLFKVGIFRLSPSYCLFRRFVLCLEKETVLDFYCEFYVKPTSIIAVLCPY